MAAVVAAGACANLDGLSGGPPTGLADASTGDGSNAANARPTLSISPRSLAFSVDCAQGAAPPTASVTLRNDTDTAQRYEIDIEGPFRVADPLTGELAPRGERTITASPAGPVSDPQTGAIHVRQGAAEDVVSLETRPDGPRLDVSPAVADFGFVRASAGSALSLTLHNSGTKPLDVDLLDLPDFAFDGPMTLGAGATAKATLTMRSGPVGVLSTTALFAPIAGHCGDLPALALRGERVSANVIAGPGTVDFGDVGCRTTPTVVQMVTLSNYSPQGLTYSATIEGPDASLFRIEGPAAGGLPAASAGTPTTTKVMLALNAPGESFGAKTAVLRFSGATDAAVTLHAKVVGAVLSYERELLEFNRNESRSTRLRNTGNLSACVGYGFAVADSAFSLVRDSDPVPAGGSGWTNVKFEASGFQAHEATIATSSIVGCSSTAPAAPLCADPPRLRVRGAR